MDYKELGKDVEEKLVDLLKNDKTRDLTVDEIQRVSRKYKLRPDLDFHDPEFYIT